MSGTDQTRRSARASSRCCHSAARSLAEVTSAERVCRSRNIVSDWLACTEDQQPRKSSIRSYTGAYESAPKERRTPRTSESGRQLASTASALRTSASTLLTQQGVQLHVSSHCRTPYLQTAPGGGTLLASDGSVLQLGPTRRAAAPLRRLPPAEVPYIINNLGAPYGMCDNGEMLPLAVSSRGELWCGPDGHPLMLLPSSQHATPGEAPIIMQVVMASGRPVWLSSGGQVGVRVRRGAVMSPVAPAVAVAVVDLSTGRDLVDDQRGQRLKVDPASLELLGPCGRPAYDPWGRPLRLVGTEPRLHPQQQMRPGTPSLGQLAACVVVVVLVAALVQLAASCGCWRALAGVLLAAAAGGTLAGLAACRPHAVPLPHPVLLNVRGRPLRDARGQRLCLTAPDVTGKRHLVTDTGDMVCVSVDSSTGQPAKLVWSLPFLRGCGSAHDVLVDAEGRPLLGRQGAVLRILQDSHQQPYLSPLGFPLALTLAGTPCLGPDGAPLSLTPDGQVLLGAQGQPLLGPRGRMLLLGGQGDLRYLGGSALCGPDKQRMYLCASGVLSRVLGTPTLSASGAELSLATCPALISSSGGVVCGPGGRPVTRGPCGTLLCYSSRSAWRMWPLAWEAASVRRSRRRGGGTGSSCSNSGLLLSAGGGVRLRRSGAVSSSRRGAATVLAYAGTFTTTLAGNSSAAGMTTVQGAATAMPRVSRRMRLLSSTTNTAATNRTAAQGGAPAAAPSSSGGVCYIPLNAAGVAILTSPAASHSTSPGSGSSKDAAGGGDLPADAVMEVEDSRGMAVLPHAASAAGTNAVDISAAAVAAAAAADAAPVSLRLPHASGVAPEAPQAAAKQLVLALDWVVVLVQLVILQHPLLLQCALACLAAASSCLAWVSTRATLLERGWATACESLAGDRARLVGAPWAWRLQYVVKQGMVLTAGLLAVSTVLLVIYPHQRYTQADLSGLPRPPAGGLGHLQLASPAGQTGQPFGSTPLLHLQLIAAAASAGLMDRPVSRRECLQLQLLGLGVPQECSQGWAHAAVAHVLGVTPPQGYPLTWVAAVTHWCLWVWPLPQVVLATTLSMLVCAWLWCSCRAAGKAADAAPPKQAAMRSDGAVRRAAPKRPADSSSSSSSSWGTWVTWLMAALLLSAAVWASTSSCVLAGEALGVAASQRQLQAAHQRQQTAAIQTYLAVVQQVAAGQDGRDTTGHLRSSGLSVSLASLEGLEHLFLPTSAAMDVPLQAAAATAGHGPTDKLQGRSSQLLKQHAAVGMAEGHLQQQQQQQQQQGHTEALQQAGLSWGEASAAEDGHAWHEDSNSWYTQDGNSMDSMSWDTSADDAPTTLLYQLMLVVGGWLQLLPVVLVVLLVYRHMMETPSQVTADRSPSYNERCRTASTTAPIVKEPSFTKWQLAGSVQDMTTLPCIPEEVLPGTAPSWQVPALQGTSGPTSGHQPWEAQSRTTSADWSVFVEPAAEPSARKARRVPSSSDADTTSGSSGSQGSRQCTSSGSGSSKAHPRAQPHSRAAVQTWHERDCIVRK